MGAAEAQSKPCADLDAGSFMELQSAGWKGGRIAAAADSSGYCAIATGVATPFSARACSTSATNSPR